MQKLEYKKVIGFTKLQQQAFKTLENGRRYLGCELKESYFDLSLINLKNAELKRNQQTLF